MKYFLLRASSEGLSESERDRDRHARNEIGHVLLLSGEHLRARNAVADVRAHGTDGRVVTAAEAAREVRAIELQRHLLGADVGRVAEDDARERPGDLNA